MASGKVIAQRAAVRGVVHVWVVGIRLHGILASASALMTAGAGPDPAYHAFSQLLRRETLAQP